MTLAALLDRVDNAALDNFMESCTPRQVSRVLQKQNPGYEDFLCLLSRAATGLLPQLAARARELTIQRFGRTLQFYAPVYLANACESGCLYCGFNRSNTFTRTVLTPAEIAREYEKLKSTGLDSVLLLTGEAPARAGVEYIAAAVKQATAYFTFTGLEIYPLTVDEYAYLTTAGADGLTIYQETYDKTTYSRMHPGGRKQNYLWRLLTPSRALEGGLRRVGLGVLLGLSDWRHEAARLALHLQYLQKQFWQGEYSLSFPRIQPFSSSFCVPAPVSDREFVQLICALRLLFPDTGFVLSTREAPALRDKLMQLCITQLSAGSRTNPGGYSRTDTEEQFAVADHRELAEMMQVAGSKGYDPVLKDWDKVF